MSEHKIRESQKEFNFKVGLEFFQSKSVTSLIIPFLLIGIIILLVYSSALNNEFVWDDVEVIKDSPLLHSFNSIPRIWSESMNLIYRPLVYSLYIFIYEIFGGNPFFFHGLGIFIHILVSCVVFVLFRKYFSRQISLLVTILFSVHPVNVEAVTWISAYSELLYVLFGMISFVFMIRFVEEKNNNISLLLSSTFLLFGFFSKESTLIFSVLSVLYLTIFARKKLLKGSVAMGIPTVLYFYIRFFLIEGVFYSQGEKFIAPIQNLSLSERVLNIPSILWYYIQTFFAPFSLHIEQYWIHEQFGFGNVVLPFVFVMMFVVGLVFIGVKIKKYHSDYLKIFLFFNGGLFLWSLMHIQILPLTMTVAERWLYGAGIFMMGIVGILLTVLKDKSQMKVTLIFLLILLVFFSGRTLIRNRDWENNMTLYGHDYKIDPNYALANNYGSELFNAGRHGEAIVYFEKSIRLKPDWWRNWTNRGVYFEQKGDRDEAIKSYKKAIINNPGYSAPYVRLASMYLFAHELDTAREYAKSGLSSSPDNAELLKVYAFILYALQEQKEAQLVAQELYRIDPSQTNKELLGVISVGGTIQINK